MIKRNGDQDADLNFSCVYWVTVVVMHDLVEGVGIEGYCPGRGSLNCAKT